MRKMSRAVLALTAALMIVGTAGPAMAIINQFDFKNNGQIDGDRVAIAGNITCTAGERFTIHFNVQQRNQAGEETYRGRGSTKGVCSGSEQIWSAWTDRNIGTPVGGDSFVTGKALTSSGGIQTDAAKDSEHVFLTS